MKGALAATERALRVLSAFLFCCAVQAPALADDSAAAFLARHWTRPLAPQGKPPANFSPIESSLNPADCGSCHAAQHADWQNALHARAMGPGLIGQLVNLPAAARDQHQDCIRCHAPLAEQADDLAAALAAPRREAPGLHRQGLSCAGCHVRAHTRYGPPRKDGSAPDAAANQQLPHGGFVAAAAFEDARFCSACHQFEADGFALNGKLLENTYAEWKASRHAGEGRTCQACHMPDRRHLWRGIHDPETVRSGVTFAPEPPTVSDRQVRAALTIRNTGSGHYFPTYVTPRLIVEIEQAGADGQALRGTRVARTIQRKVPLDLSREVFDTRLPPDGEMRLDYRQPKAKGATTLIYRLRVEPDEYYARFYRSILANGEAGRGAPLIREALRQAETSGFIAYERRSSL